MTRFDLIAHTGAVKEYRGFYQPMRLSKECKRRLYHSLPRRPVDEILENIGNAVLTVVGVVVPPAVLITFAVLFARWWMCA